MPPVCRPGGGAVVRPTLQPRPARLGHYSALRGLSLWSLNIVGGEILTFPDTLTTQGLSLWSLNIVGGEILTFPDTLTTQGLSLWSLNIA